MDEGLKVGGQLLQMIKFADDQAVVAERPPTDDG